jgi:tetratricopeptide (TPR) repeat protein
MPRRRKGPPSPTAAARAPSGIGSALEALDEPPVEGPWPTLGPDDDDDDDDANTNEGGVEQQQEGQQEEEMMPAAYAGRSRTALQQRQERLKRIFKQDSLEKAEAEAAAALSGQAPPPDVTVVLRERASNGSLMVVPGHAPTGEWGTSSGPAAEEAEPLAVDDGNNEKRYVMLAVAGRRQVRKRDYLQAVPYFRAALQYKGGIGPARVIPTYRYLGKCLIACKQLDGAIQAHTEELRMAQAMQDASLTARAYGNVGHALRANRQFNEAIQCFENQDEICSLCNDKQGRTAALENLGRSYQEVATAWQARRNKPLCSQYFHKALDYYRKCLKSASQLRDKHMLGRAYGGIGVVCEQLEDYVGAIAAYRRRLRLAQQLKDEAAEGRALCNMGNAFRALERYDKALECYAADLTITERLDDRFGIAITCRHVGAGCAAFGIGVAPWGGL